MNSDFTEKIFAPTHGAREKLLQPANFRNMPSRYLLTRLRLMGPGELVRRLVELALDYLRFPVRHLLARHMVTERFRRMLVLPDHERLSMLWEARDWHEKALERLLNGQVEINEIIYSPNSDSPWTYCPDNATKLPMIMGRRYLFDKMYRMANMQYIGTLNRHYHLVHLAKAARLGKIDERQVIEKIDDWIDANPYLEGINWADALHVSIRVINWCLIFTYLGKREIPANISQSFYRHGTFIEQHFSYGSSAGNHLLGEYCALFFLGCCLPGLPKAHRWREMGRRGLETEVERQFFSDGTNREQSLSYHRYLLEYLILALILADGSSMEFSEIFRGRVLRGLHVLADLSNGIGEVPLIGDCGHEITTDIHYLSFRGNDLFQSVIQMGAIYFRDTRLKSALCNKTIDDRQPWFFDERRLRAYENMDTCLLRCQSSACREAGYYIMGDGRAVGEETRLVVRCGPMGLSPLYAHAHADQLSFVLTCHGRQFLVDPGTYGYHFKGATWRQYFRGSHAHNTLVVGNIDQAVSGGAMIWLSPANGHMTCWEAGVKGCRFEGWHDGYLRQPDVAGRHWREIRLDNESETIEIRDRLDAHPSPVTLYFHFHPEVNLTHCDANTVIATRDGRQIRLHFDSRLELKDFKGCSEPPRGWYSNYFGVKNAAHTLALAGQIDENTTILTRIHRLTEQEDLDSPTALDGCLPR